jgi:copper(I)-binding protein
VSREQIMRKRSAPAVLRSTLVGIAAALALSALALSGCAAGQITQTDAQVAAVNGASGDLGPIALRDAVLAYPGGDVFGYAPGDEAPLLVTIVNSGDQTDELVSVSTPAGEVVVGGMTTIPGGFVVSSLELARAPGPPSAVADAADPPLGSGELRIVLTDLTGPIRPGLPTFVTFGFRDAGEVTLRVPIDAPAETRPQPAEGSP